MTYIIETSERAMIDLVKLKRSEPVAYKKAIGLIRELENHPTTGTGHPEPLTGNRAGQWSRRINQKHRLVYKIFDDKVVVLVLSAYGHYDDK